MKAHLQRFALYNRWANARLYEAALALSETEYRRDVGAFFRACTAPSIICCSPTAFGSGG
ncbi:MAG TPA: hypothetical protein VFR19_13755 [Hyphomicrobiaceae bacterium]|jgi:uncharacterized damage-inducible protein DinB|nr:hypothetical protein [Hyphomicrobiaceae bacterium]